MQTRTHPLPAIAARYLPDRPGNGSPATDPNEGRIGNPRTFGEFIERAADLLREIDPNQTDDKIRARFLNHTITEAEQAAKRGTLHFNPHAYLKVGSGGKRMVRDADACWESLKALFRNAKHWTITTANLYVDTKRFRAE